jgi:hypothetical protein
VNSIFDKNNNEALIKRIHLLDENSKPLWGKMNVSQMLSHCQAPIDLALGNIEIKSNFFLGILGRIFKSKILNAGKFKKNSVTLTEFSRSDFYEFEQNKIALIKKISTFAVLGDKSIKKTKHPIFGKMSYEEWDKLQYMHLDHHLRQFGV